MSPLSVTPVVGLPQFLGWSQVVENAHHISGRLVCAFAIAGEHAGNVGRDAAQSIGDQSLITAHELFEFLTKLVQEVESKDCQIHFACGLFAGHMSVFATHGGSIFLKRADKAGQIVQSDRKLVLVEGRHEPGDAFVLSTRQASEFLSEITQKFTQGYDVDTIITSIVPGVHGQDDSSLSALAFVAEETPLEMTEAEEELEGGSREREAEATVSQIEVPRLEVQESAAQESVVAELLKPSEASTAPAAKQKKVRWQLAGERLVELLKRSGTFLRSTIAAGLKKRQNTDPATRSAVDPGTHPSVRLGSRLGRTQKVAVVLLAAVLIGGLGVWQWRSRVQAETAQAQAIVEPVAGEIAAAQEQLASDPVAARERMATSIAQLEALAVEHQDKKRTVELINEELASARAWYEANSGKNEVNELPVFYDLRLAKSDFIASDVGAGSDRALFVDTEKKQLVLLDLQRKQVTLFSAESLGQIKSVRLRADDAVILADGLYSLELTDGAQPARIIDEGDSNRNATFMGAYESFLYVFNPERRNIYRYAQTQDGYTDPIGWLQASQGLVFEDVASLAIDGDIWLATKNGEVKRFTRGQEVAFEVRGLQDAFTGPIKLYTTIDLSNLYILDASAGRLVILSKEGEFLKEIKSNSLSSATTLFVSEAMGKAFAVSGSTVFEVGL